MPFFELSTGFFGVNDCSIILAIVALLPLSLPLPTTLSSRWANSSGTLMLIILRSPALCLAITLR